MSDRKMNYNIERADAFNQRVDKDGCLDLIQQLEYDGQMMTFDVTFFTGWSMKFDAGSFCTGLDMMVSDLTLKQMREAYTRIEEYSLTHWKGWYVNRFAVRN